LGIDRTINYVDEKFSKSWFSGAYTYFLPKGWNSSTEKLGIKEMLDNIFNITPTPESLWKLTPWSWAFDWFSNTSEILHNLSAFAGDALMLRYGYIMRHSVAKRTYSARQPITLRNQAGSCAVVEFVHETKQRKHADPYGFGISSEGLSATQKAIMTALGLSKGL